MSVADKQGTVLEFNHGCGEILYLDNGREKQIRFSSNDFYYLNGVDGEIIWDKTLWSNISIHLRDPLPGDTLVFDIMVEKYIDSFSHVGTPRYTPYSFASPWTFLQVKELADKNKLIPVVQIPVYRYLRRRKKVSDQEWSKTYIQWQGSNLTSKELFKHYRDPGEVNSHFFYYHSGDLVDESWFESSTRPSNLDPHITIGPQIWTICPSPIDLPVSN